MPTCSTCHATVPTAAAFCPTCGAATVRADPAAATVLPDTSFTEIDRGGEPRRAPAARAAPAGGTGATRASGEDFAPGEILGRRYRIVGLLGRGGMGAVYRADDLKLGQPVALKFLSPELERDPAALARLHAEVRNARQVSHPHVCRVHDIDEVGGRHFLTMEYVDGEDLASLLHRIGRLPEAKAAEIGRQIAAGLEAAHARGVVHRDLKPANVMIDGHGRAKITDFGLAVTAADRRGELAGTPPYMAPELFAGEPATVQSDLYALGLVLYEVFTGKRPFESQTLLEWKRTHESTLPESPARHVKDLEPQVERLILRCLEKDPARRPHSAAHVASALVGGDPLAAAMAAGETPSPEMVAAADAGAALRPPLAWAGFAIAVALLLGLAFASRVNDYAWVPFERSPEALADRAAELAEELGYGPPPAGQVWGYERDGSFLGWEDDPLGTGSNWPRMTRGQPLAYVFWYRQDPLPIEPASFGGGWPDPIRRTDPPLTHAGAVEILLDPRGRLVSFESVSPATLPDAAALAPLDVAWGRLFAAAGLDPQAFAASPPVWLPPRFADLRLSWSGVYPDHPDLPLRIEAAALGGLPIWFRLVGPWEAPPATIEAGFDSSRIAAAAIALALGLTVLVTAGVAARRNFLAGRGDRAGAARLAVATASTTIAAGLLMTDLPFTLTGVLTACFRLAVAGLLYGALSWLAYMALEPYIRRHWPLVLVSWTRLLGGRLRDPLLGRDLLAGILCGLLIAAAFVASGWAKYWSHSPYRPNFYLLPDSLNGLRHTAGFVFGQLAWSLMQVFIVLLLLVLLRRLVQRQGMALFLLWLLWSAVPTLVWLRSWPSIAALLLTNALFLWVVVRRGLVAGVAAGATSWAIQSSPITANLRAPYAGSSTLVLVGLALLAFAAAWTAQARASRSA